MQTIKLPEWELIPSVGLYLEQVTKFVNDYIPSGLNMELTPTMITNYVKLKIVPKGIKKTYTRNQIAEFIIIAYLKTVISMDQIRIIFSHYDLSENTKDFYDNFKSSLEGKKIKNDKITALSSTVLNKIKLDEMIELLTA